jgi:hypothetical protein
MVFELMMVAGRILCLSAPETVLLEQGVDGYVGFADTSIYEESENAGGGNDGIFVGTTKLFEDRRGLVRIDLSDFPSYAVFTEVSLTMMVERSAQNFGDFGLSLYRVNRAWGEGSVVGADQGGFGGTPDTGDATWLSSAHGVTPWDAPGGDFAGTPRTTSMAGQAGAVVTWSSEAMLSDIQTWHATPESNHGWILISDIEGEKQRAKKLYSSEATGNRPVLTVVVDIDPIGDHDADGLLNTEEVTWGTDPFVADSDGDSIPDGTEVSLGLDPLEPDVEISVPLHGVLGLGALAGLFAVLGICRMYTGTNTFKKLRAE